MQVEVKIDENCKDPKIIIVADKMTDEIGALCLLYTSDAADD